MIVVTECSPEIRNHGSDAARLPSPLLVDELFKSRFCFVVPPRLDGHAFSLSTVNSNDLPFLYVTAAQICYAPAYPAADSLHLMLHWDSTTFLSVSIGW